MKGGASQRRRGRNKGGRQRRTYCLPSGPHYTTLWRWHKLRKERIKARRVTHSTQTHIRTQLSSVTPGVRQVQNKLQNQVEKKGEKTTDGMRGTLLRADAAVALDEMRLVLGVVVCVVFALFQRDTHESCERLSNEVGRVGGSHPK